MPDAFARRGLRRPTRFVRHSGARRRRGASCLAPAACGVSERSLCRALRARFRLRCAVSAYRFQLR
ncbi:dihydrolipoamide dehydrogenase [Burkholderia sp. MSMB617WGS]|nr:dihydrolipoamide dehydrogenase [Burkholderia savannae]AOK50905.1 dihydrolipoamide dehydrogenase [Burkholderia sp. MSMB617WGS]KVG46164.1 dihydrolipoamide dehydrogenase [Burkholderia sp. MSMB0265]KVG89690.1 dihydrolipoamide dehydrogenase [Burkholderia sp. MSMB2040]KVG91689.1 dihydrolipoamide dehydrogenase [Burkholderia sp. MSMB2041]KVH00923.1 dihydrolipoamide dehydrogenase [Burkholderia sp. MSMB2042]KVK90091.1 dihydrolipoamide dehydrogenase [Burkholderia sp. MSMB1498]